MAADFRKWNSEIAVRRWFASQIGIGAAILKDDLAAELEPVLRGFFSVRFRA